MLPRRKGKRDARRDKTASEQSSRLNTHQRYPLWRPSLSFSMEPSLSSHAVELYRMGIFFHHHERLFHLLARQTTPSLRHCPADSQCSAIHDFFLFFGHRFWGVPAGWKVGSFERALGRQHWRSGNVLLFFGGVSGGVVCLRQRDHWEGQALIHRTMDSRRKLQHAVSRVHFSGRAKSE